MKIEISLGDRDIGTTATVTVRRFFKMTVSKYVCHRASPISGAQWIDEATGIAPKPELESKINEAAQAAVRLVCGSLKRG